MGTQYYCKNKQRRELVQQHGSLNGIDCLEVVDKEAPREELRQLTLLVRCFKSVQTLTGGNVRIEGGVRVKNIKVLWAMPATEVEEPITTGELPPEPEKLLVVRTDRYGDFSTYTLRLVKSPTDPNPPGDFDPLLSEVEFSFKAECPSQFDCRMKRVCPPEREPPGPFIDYLSRDYSSFRRLMLDRLAVAMPQWQERSPADVGIAIVELLAQAADHLSYYQDAVATEAYLGTARRRVSVRRHARLLDYRLHEGCNARAWVHFVAEPDAETPDPLLPKGTPLLTKVAGQPTVLGLTLDELRELLGRDTRVFETMEDLRLRAAHNQMYFHTWGDEECCLPRGATRATLQNTDNQLEHLAAGDVLLFEEIFGPQSGLPQDADPAHRHVVRLTAVAFDEDKLLYEDEAQTQFQRVVEIEWAAADALPFPLCLRDLSDSEQPDGYRRASVARGNIVLADHGWTIKCEGDSEGLQVPASGALRVPEKDITYRAPYDPDAASWLPASAEVEQDPHNALPAVTLWEVEPDNQRGDQWKARADLLGSGRFARDFVVEMTEDRTAQLRFGDGVHGRRPAAGASFHPDYRIGNGQAGNVGAEAICHVVTDEPAIQRVRNPLPAQGGTDPEPVERVRLHAPQAFRVQQRAVTDADYAVMAQRHPEVQKAAATRRWTGSWYTVFITVDRKGGRAVDARFEREIRAFLERFRLAGHDIEVEAPQLVPLDIAMLVCVAAGYYGSKVKESLLEAFSNHDQPGGGQGFFHPDQFTFGQPVYLSRLVARAMQLPGVQWVDVTRFQRWGREPLQELENGRIPMERLEIAQLDNDPSLPENGRIEFKMEGGL